MLTIRKAERSDFHGWSLLYKEYLDFYKTMLTVEQLIILWNWFFDDEKKMYCSIAFSKDTPVGLVHFREFLRPIKASVGIFIDDLFVESTHRGQGIAQKLIKSVEEFALQKNIPVVRWITANDNHEAMKVYDKLAVKTKWITYDMTAL
ncbi:GNAT family N-acetyltransferase [Legionella nagasakiensis]|uniref:GNAT family N-acetyltransferase n=1 Tax=Legionella nagasakiensis TaxID=535290 RepID=UPI001054C551|nr:GNAT family N-acetyltransferase [Legionella nagasakiensis]